MEKKKSCGCLAGAAALLGILAVGAVFRGANPEQPAVPSSSETQPQSAAAESVTESNAESAESESAPEQTAEDSRAESPVIILSHEIRSGIDGKDLLVIEFEFTNITDKAANFATTFTDKVYQNGVECEQAYFEDLDSPSQMADILPGVTATIKLGYYLHDMTAANVVVTEWIGSTEYLNETLDLGGGAGEQISADAETAVAIAGHRMSKDYQGNDVLIVDYTYTNGESKPESFMWSFSAQAYQNGVACSDTVIGCDDLDLSMLSADIQPGVTVTVSIGYELADSSDVQIIVTKYLHDDALLDETIPVS